jgi:hypothetical protein
MLSKITVEHEKYKVFTAETSTKESLMLAVEEARLMINQERLQIIHGCHNIVYKAVYDIKLHQGVI